MRRKGEAETRICLALRFFIVLFCVLGGFVLPSMAAQAFPEPMPGTQAYDFSSITGESVKNSMGTFSGFSSREPTHAKIVETDRERMKTRVASGNEMCFFSRMLVSLPEDSHLEAKALAWQEQAKNSLLEKWNQPDIVFPLDMGDEDTIYFEEEVSLTDELLCLLSSDDYECRTAVFSLRTGEQLRLSDLFYEGVNYIGYINKSIVQNMHKEGDWGNDRLNNYFYYTLETQQIAPFTGFDRDYPFFQMIGSRLILHLPAVNPFFALDGRSTGGLNVGVALTKKVSPYGSDYKVETEYYTLHVPLVARDIPQYKVRINDGENIAVDEAINQSLLQKVENAMRSFPKEVWAMDEVEPFYITHGRLFSIRHEAYKPWPHEDDVDVVLYGVVYNMDTGLEINLEPVARTHWLEAEVFERSDTLYTKRLPYQLTKNELDKARFVDGWIYTRRDTTTLFCRFQLEEGGYIVLQIPWDADWEIS